MEVPQGNSLCNYLNKQKCHLVFFFSYTNLENRRAELFLPGDVGTSGSGERRRRWEKGVGG
jgi:hypothetical protein